MPLWLWRGYWITDTVPTHPAPANNAYQKIKIMNKDNMYVGLRGGGRLGCNYSLKLEETEVIYKFLGPGLYHDLAFFFRS